MFNSTPRSKQRLAYLGLGALFCTAIGGSIALLSDSSSPTAYAWQKETSGGKILPTPPQIAEQAETKASDMTAPWVYQPKQPSQKELYRQYLSQHPYTTRQKFTKKELKAMGVPKKDRPDLARERDFLMTQDPATHTIPKFALAQARAQVKDLLKQKKDKAAISGVSWTERGPNNVGGRTRALMFDPNDATKKKVWAGSVGGGLWSNNDITSGNSTWQKVDDMWANLAVTTIAYDPNNTQVFYVGTGEGWGNADAILGEGIWKTTNGGITWGQLASTTPANTGEFGWIQKIAVHSSGAVFAATLNTGQSAGGVMRSTDGGLTWTKINTTAAADVEIAANGDVYVGGFGGQVLRTTNPTAASPTWTTITPTTGGQRVEIAVAPSASSATASTTLYAVASNGSGNIAWFRKSTDGGTTWTSITVPKYLNQNCSVSTTDFTRGQSWYDLILKVRPDDANVVIAGGVDLHGTTNGGTSWNALSYWTGSCKSYAHADQHAIEFRGTNYNEIIAGNDGGVVYSSNAGTGAANPTFSPRNNGYNVTQFYACAMRNTASSNIYLAGAQDNGTLRFSSAGINSTTEVNGGDGAFCFIDQTNPNIAIASYVYNNFYRSTDGGLTFGGTLIGENTGDFINPADYNSVENVLYTAGNAGQLKVITNVEGTPNAAQTFSPGITGSISTIKANTFTTSRIFVGTSGGDVYRIDNASSSPTATDIGTGLPAGYISSIDVGSSDNELLVTISNYNMASVYYSNNGGTTWVNKDNGMGLPNIPVRWGLFNPENTKQVLLATELGVWSTNDITASNPGWEVTSTGLANVRCDMLRYRTSDKQVAIATHGRGLYTTDYFAATGNPVANFTISPRPVLYQPMQATFTDASVGNVTSRSWNFGSGASTATATTVGPHSISYSTLGKKTVSLTLNGGSNSTQDLVMLPKITPPYAPADGGNFETANNHYHSTGSTSMVFERGNSAIAGKNGTAGGSFAYVTGLSIAQYPSDCEAILYTPNYDFSTTGAYSLSFKTKFDTEETYDGFIVEYSTNQGATWTQLGSAVGTGWYNSVMANDTQGSFTANTAFFSGTIASFETKTYDCSALAGNTNVAFRFVFRSDPSLQKAGVAIDDFQITAPAQPLALTTLSPAHNATGVDATTNLVMTFNNAVQKGTGNLVIKKATDNSVLETIAVTATGVTIANNVVTINPTNDLPAGTQVYVEVANGAIKDLSNNAYAGFSGNSTWLFTTAADVAAPTLLTLSPANNATGVSPTANLLITFNETVAKGTGDLVIKKVSDNTVFETIAVTATNVTISGATVTIDPTNALASNTQYYVEVASGAIKDLSNNVYAGFSGNTTWKFTTADIAAPTLVSLSPANGATDAANNANLVMTFNENIAKGTGNIIIKRSSDNSVIETIDVAGNLVTVSNAVMTINPANDLPAGVQVYVEVANGAIKDLSNNAYAGFSGNSTWQFTTVDITAPTLLTLSPANNATGVSPTANLLMTFNETVAKGTGDLVIKKVSDNTVFETIAVTATNVTISGATVTIDPTNALASETQYYVEVASGAIKDLSNNVYAGFSGNTTWKFTTADIAAPTLVSLSPANGATDAANNANLVMTFNENIAKGTGNIVIKRSNDNVVIETIDVAGNLVTVSNAVMTINPANDLAGGVQYYVEVASTAVKDLANNAFAGFSGSSTWQFTTVDVTAPLSITLSPANNATGVLLGTNLVVTFNENVKKGTGNIAIRKSSDGSLVESIAVSSTQVSISNAVVTIDPANDLAPNTQYYVEVPNGAIQDIAGNNFAGLTTATSWRFTTIDTASPTLLALNPANNTQNVPGANNLVMTFNEAMKKNTAGTIVIKKVSDNATVETFDMSTTSRVTVAGATVTINPTNDLAHNTEFYVEVSNGALADLAGNSYAGFLGSTTWKFKTDFSTAVGDPQLSTVFQLYPNPMEKVATLQSDEQLYLKDVRLEVIDAHGVSVWQADITQLPARQPLDFQSLSAGKYLLQISIGDKRIYKPFVKLH